ncbi:hypothetical protein MBLNU459_g4101t1 [Dothideomycetes sp. NU459]
MADLEDKENCSPVRLGSYATPHLKSPSPRKPVKKARSKSIGPGGLDEATAPEQKSPDRDRRKSAFTPAPKSILPSKEDEAKRRAARRKSLANRRVSFAPEATLHTWDVIEYMRDATTSSASSENSRRTSSNGAPSFAGTPGRQAWEPESDPPSTPPEQADDGDDLPASPEPQRGVHQKKRRRSSAIPPMNFNNPEDDFSSSPVSGSSVADGSSDVEEVDDDDDKDDDGEEDSADDSDSTAMSLDTGDNSMRSEQSEESTDSSLTARLRQASHHAGTRGIEYDEHGDMSMEIATDDVTNAFKPWVQQAAVPALVPIHLGVQEDQENINPFSPAFRKGAAPKPVQQTRDEDADSDDDDDDDDDMSMDMTHAVGGILRSAPPEEQDQDEDQDDTAMSMDITRAIGGILRSQQTAVFPLDEETQSFGDETMDFTQAVGQIFQPSQARPEPPRSALKRRHSTTEEGSPSTSNKPTSPAPQRRTVAQTRDAKRRRSSVRSSLGDAPMDLTMAIGGIQHNPSPARGDRRTSLRRRRSSGVSSVAEDQTMDFTTALGGIRQTLNTVVPASITEEDIEQAEELSMDFTASTGAITSTNTTKEIPKPVTPRHSLSPKRTEVPTTPKDQERFREATDFSVKKLLTPVFEKQVSNSAVKDSAGSQKSHASRGSARKSPSAQRSAQKTPINQSNAHKGAPSDSPSGKSPVRKSPLSVRRSARKSLFPILAPLPEVQENEDALSAAAGGPAETESPQQVAERIQGIEYPVLPSPVLDEPSDLISTPQVRSHPTVSEAGSPIRHSPMRTPLQVTLQAARSPSPTLEKQLRISPTKAAKTSPQATPRDVPNSILTSMKLMSTPRKDTGTSPLKRLRGLTPKKSPVKQHITPRKVATPRARTPATAAKTDVAELVGQRLASDLFAAVKTGHSTHAIHLNEFLDMAGIKFMDLTTTKRRHTIAPTPGRTTRTNGEEQQASQPDLESAVVAGACTVPMLDLFQHSCRELKRYISEGKSFLKTLETEVYQDPPPLIQAYVNASPERKIQLDGHMSDAKTQARLRSKEIWYDWRSKLLDGLEDGLKGIEEGLEADVKILGDQEQLLESILPDLLQSQESMQAEAQQLEDAAAAVSAEEKEELNLARDRLSEVDNEIEERKRMLARFQEELQEQERLVEAYGEGKAECLAAIQEADRVKEASRGWSMDEVIALKASVERIEQQAGWTITSASAATLTMTYCNSLQLFFDTSTFASPSSSQSTPIKKENAPISLTYIAASTSPLTTDKRFFLQLMRAQLQCLDQAKTSVKHLLRFVSSGWDVTVRVAEAIRKLSIDFPVETQILSDERLGIDVSMLLPKVETRVLIAFEIAAAVEIGGKDGSFRVGTGVGVKGSVVYGEQYNERNMGEFIGKRIAGHNFGGWDEAVRELRLRLVATGRKGR